MLGSAMIAMVPSSVAISCMPVMATMATPSTLEARGLAGGSGTLTSDMGSYPTERPAGYGPSRRPSVTPPRLCRRTRDSDIAGVDGFLDFLGVRHLAGGVADEQGHRTDDDRDRRHP